MITPKTLEECDNISCTECSNKNDTICGYGFHIDGSPFPIYDFSRCNFKRQLEINKKR